MATLKKSVLGKVSGAVGDLLFRLRNGKNFIGMRPSSFMPGTDPDSIARRNRFRIDGKFSSAVNSINPLNALWEKFTPSTMLPFNYIFKLNYYNVIAEDMTDAAQLVPDVGFDVPGPTITMSSSQIQVQTLAIGTGTGIDPLIETDFQLVAVVYMKDKTDENYQDYMFLQFVFDKQTLSLVDPLTFTIDLSDAQAILYNRYNVHTGYFALLSLDALEEPIHFSNTFIS